MRRNDNPSERSGAGIVVGLQQSLEGNNLLDRLRFVPRRPPHSFFFEVFAAVFAGELRNVVLCELVEGLLENGAERRRGGVHGGSFGGGEPCECDLDRLVI